jgi:CDP-glycerol glycerophosphotransferase (TagB/SpsB family)
VRDGFLVILYNKKHARSFLETDAFEALFRKYKSSSTLVYTEEISHLIFNKRIKTKKIKISSNFAYKLGRLLYASLLWKKKYVAMSFYRRAIFNYSSKKTRLNNVYPTSKLDNSGHEFYRFLVRLVSIEFIFTPLYALRKYYINFYFTRLFDNSKIDLQGINAVFIPFSGLISPVFDDLINFFNLKGIKTIAIQDNWDNLSSKTFINSNPSYVCVWGEQSAAHVTNFHAMKGSKIVVTGSARLAPYYSNLKKFEKYRQIPVELDRIIRRKYILFIGTGDGVDDNAILHKVISSINLKRDFQIVYRPHPFTRTEIEELKLKKLKKLGVIIDMNLKSNHVYHHCGLVMNADLIITQLSSIIVEGLLCNQKILIPCFVYRKVNYDYMDAINTYPHLIGLGAIPNIFISKNVNNFAHDLEFSISSPKLLSSNSANWFAAKFETNKKLLNLFETIN